MRRAALALALALGPAAAAAQTVTGVWTSLGIESCNPASDAVIRITGEEVRYWESLCRIGNPVAVRGLDATLYDAECSGEGETWQTRLLLAALPEDGALLMTRFGAQVLIRCPAGSVTDNPAPREPAK